MNKMNIQTEVETAWHYRPAWNCLGIREKLVGLEIGVDKGINACLMNIKLDIKKLYLIDPYFEQSDLETDLTEDGERPFIHPEEGEKRVLREASYDIAKKNLKDNGFENKVEWLIGTTEEMISQIPDNSLDFIYIDGSHEYKFVKQDIILSFPKLVYGGTIGGHDFIEDHLGVVQAVLEIFGVDQVFVTNRDWWVHKYLK